MIEVLQLHSTKLEDRIISVQPSCNELKAPNYKQNPKKFYWFKQVVTLWASRWTEHHRRYTHLKHAIVALSYYQHNDLADIQRASLQHWSNQ